ncbi:PDZ domain-containing protein [Streptomyces sp. NPDC050704]|uniref:PDZ domain-containing protein n=1 Tax=Streptomyces sp. NPDC050704 TaxID=3157219 RepID=UPI003418B53F
MEQTALRPKPMPGQEPGGGPKSGTVRRPHAARRRGRRLMTLLFGLFVGTVLVLSGVGLGTVGATVIGMSKLADLQKQASASGASALSPGPSGAKPAPSAGSSASPRDRAQHRPKSLPKERPSLGVEAVDATGGPGALLVGVHVPGPAHTAGLVRGDVLLVVGGTRIDSAADLARAVATARPGRTVTLTVRHASGGYQQLTATPGVIT